MPTRSRPKLDFALGRVPNELQSLLPRFRHGAGKGMTYMFAWPFKRSPYWMAIWPQSDEWGTLHGWDILTDYHPSNTEAREAMAKWEKQYGGIRIDPPGYRA